MLNKLTHILSSALLVSTVSSCIQQEDAFLISQNHSEESNELISDPASQVVLLAQSGNIILPTYDNCMDFYSDVFMAGGTSVDIPCVSSGSSISINTPWQSNISIVEIDDKAYFEVAITDSDNHFDQAEVLEVHRDNQVISKLELTSKKNDIYVYHGELSSIVINETNIDMPVTVYYNLLPVAQVSTIIEDDIAMKWIIEDHAIVESFVFEDNIMMRTTMVNGELIEEWSISDHTTIQKFANYTKVVRDEEDIVSIDWVIEDDIIFLTSPSESPLVIHAEVKDDVILGFNISNEFVYEDNIIFRSQRENQDESTGVESSLFTISEGYSNVFEDHVFLRTDTNPEDIQIDYIIEEHVMMMDFVTEDHVMLMINITDTGITTVQIPTEEQYEIFTSVDAEGEDDLIVTAVLTLQEGEESDYPLSLVFKNESSDTLPELSLAQKSFSSVTYQGVINKVLLSKYGTLQVFVTEEATSN